MRKKSSIYQLKSIRLWKDNIVNGFAVFGFISAIFSIIGITFSDFSTAVTVNICLIISLYLISYLGAIIYQWMKIKDSISMDIRGIHVSVREGDIFKENGWKVIGVDDTFSTSEDDRIISHSSLHGKFLELLRNNNEVDQFKTAVVTGNNKNNLGSVKTYNDYILLVWSHLDENYEAHIDSSNYESILRKMWQEIGRVYSGKPIFLPLIGDGITRFDGVSRKPKPEDLLKCMLCTLKNSNVQIKAPITILIYDRINEIKLYELKEFAKFD